MDSNVDFDGDGDPGGTIGGFIAPQEIMSEDYAAYLTCFVGEGDSVYEGGYGWEVIRALKMGREKRLL